MTAAEKLAARCASLPTEMLCTALVAVDKPKPSAEQRILYTQILDTLCARHPEVDAAFDRWAADPSADWSTPVAAITAAALAAAS